MQTWDLRYTLDTGIVIMPSWVGADDARAARAGVHTGAEQKAMARAERLGVVVARFQSREISK
jgi:hypothetical protein